MLITYALTYTLMPSLRSETNILVIYLFSAIYFFFLVFWFFIKKIFFCFFFLFIRIKGFVLPQNDSLQSPNSSKKIKTFLKSSLSFF